MSFVFRHRLHESGSGLKLKSQLHVCQIALGFKHLIASKSLEGGNRMSGTSIHVFVVESGPLSLSSERCQHVGMRLLLEGECYANS